MLRVAITGDDIAVKLYLINRIFGLNNEFQIIDSFYILNYI